MDAVVSEEGAGVAVGSGVDLSDLHFEADEVSVVVTELDIPSVIPLETQGWLVARIMAAVSLVFASRREEDYFASLQRLPLGAQTDEEIEYARAALQLISADVLSALRDDRGAAAVSPELQEVEATAARRLADADMVLGIRHH